MATIESETTRNPWIPRSTVEWYPKEEGKKGSREEGQKEGTEK
jgi:hypothetical protein